MTLRRTGVIRPAPNRTIDFTPDGDVTADEWSRWISKVLPLRGVGREESGASTTTSDGDGAAAVHHKDRNRQGGSGAEAHDAHISLTRGDAALALYTATLHHV